MHANDVPVVQAQNESAPPPTQYPPAQAKLQVTTTEGLPPVLHSEVALHCSPHAAADKWFTVYFENKKNKISRKILSKCKK